MPTITTSSPLPDGSVGDFYSVALQATGGVPPYTWRNKAGTGSPPAGVVLNANGTLSGTPTTAGTTTWTVEVLDALGSVAERQLTMTVTSGEPPTVTRYDPLFRRTTGCTDPFLVFATDEELDYTDADGDVDFSMMLLESAGGPPSGIESEYRFESQANWNDFFDGKDWSFQAGASGASGELRDIGGTCWNPPSETDTFMDMRVRIQDSAGNWSAWFTTRLEFPASVEVSPQGTNVVAPGATQQFTAVARDKNGLVSPGDPIMWTSYTGAALGSVDDDGLYTAATTAVGLDLVYGCAGLAFNFAGVLVSNVGGGDYWAPCWSIGSGLGVAAGTFLHYRMTVYAGKEYAFDTDTDGGGGTTGNADLYLRFGNPPTTSIWEVRRATTSVKENVTWTAPSDGVVWISI